MTTSAEAGHDVRPRPDMSDMLLVHAAFRRDFARFVRACGDLPTAPAPALPALAAYWDFLTGMLTHHHHGEDERLWPLLRARAPEAGELLDAMEAEHGAVDAALARATARLHAYAAVPSPALRERLADDVLRVAQVVGAHLDHEESAALPLVAETLSVEEWSRFGKYARGSVPPAQAAVALPWLLDGAPDAVRTAMLGALPPTVRSAVELTAAPAYRAMVAPLA